MSAVPLNVVLVGVGSSAGGLPAFTSFFEAVPAASGLTFVVVSHVSPHRASLLGPLLSRRTHLPVSEIADGDRPENNHVYVPPAWSQVRLEAGLFRLSSLGAVGERSRRIDVFLTSMARASGARCAGVVLSGGGADGTQGIEAVAAVGGMTLAQAPATALHDRMPLSAIATGRVQHVLHPSEMPAVIIRHFNAIGPEQTTPSAEALAI